MKNTLLARVAPTGAAVAAAIAITTMCAPAASAAERDPDVGTLEPGGTFSLLLENDGAAGTDQRYTNGFELSYLSSASEGDRG